jgi:Na+/melibiose symporter-like transporter
MKPKTITLDDFEDKIEEWHKRYYDSTPLHEYLGITREQYNELVERGKTQAKRSIKQKLIDIVTKNNNEWLVYSSMWVVIGTLSAIMGDFSGFNVDYNAVTGSIFAALMCLAYRDVKNKLEKK